MTFSTLLMIFALAAGPGTSPIYTPSTNGQGTEEPVGPCFINGVWYNPCPQGTGTPWDPEPPPPPPDTDPLG